MKKTILNFFQRGLIAAAGGPVILAMVYAILGANGTIVALSPEEVVKGILSSTLLAFLAAGITVIYSVERLPLFAAILIHGGVLYADYILIYLFNGWIKSNWLPLTIFTVSFVAGYAVIWLCIYLGIRHSTKKLSQSLPRD